MTTFLESFEERKRLHQVPSYKNAPLKSYGGSKSTILSPAYMLRALITFKQLKYASWDIAHSICLGETLLMWFMCFGTPINLWGVKVHACGA